MSGIDPNVRKQMAGVEARIRKSASGYVRVSKFKTLDRAAARALIEEGRVEHFESPLGPAYRLVVSPEAPVILVFVAADEAHIARETFPNSATTRCGQTVNALMFATEGHPDLPPVRVCEVCRNAAA